ncbi:hypothetical protein ECE50_020990 [Chitinophaga sp. Mgbs1]|uniref:Uncharacterized protein n=1 Tax=Chitinophaga solisilvae TaxID=1233460 RepID=A0A9Q5GU45_9BACT|nr:hypothetical protein [Chitinophaga solisilvae]
MFYAHSLEDNKFDFFISFLGHVLKGDENYKSLVQPIIEEAHALANGSKNFYTIDRDGFPIIVYLVEKEHEFFKTLNPAALSLSQYDHIYNLVNNRELAAF